MSYLKIILSHKIMVFKIFLLLLLYFIQGVMQSDLAIHIWFLFVRVISEGALFSINLPFCMFKEKVQFTFMH